MFGIAGLFCDGRMFAVIADERVFLKTDEANRRDFLRERAAPFVYRTRSGDEIVTSYYELPAHLFECPDEAVAWARGACEIAVRRPALQRKHQKRPKPKTSRQPPRRRRRS